MSEVDRSTKRRTRQAKKGSHQSGPIRNQEPESGDKLEKNGLKRTEDRVHGANQER